MSGTQTIREILCNNVEPYFEKEPVKIDVPLSFIEAAEQNNFGAMKKIKINSININGTESFYSALHYAVIHNNPDKSRVGHYVGVYSFDARGLWVAESIRNKLMRLPYDEVFTDDGLETKYFFYTIKRK